MEERELLSAILEELKLVNKGFGTMIEYFQYMEQKQNRMLEQQREQMESIRNSMPEPFKKVFDIMSSKKIGTVG